MRALLRPKAGQANLCLLRWREDLCPPNAPEGGIFMPDHLWDRGWKGLKPAGDNHKPARNIIFPTGVIFRGKFVSKKNGCMMKHEGLLEGDALYHFEVSPQIASYREQPITLTYPDGNRTRRYTPDFEIVLQSGEQVYIEIKPERNLAKEEVQHKLTCVSDYLKRSGIRFVTLTEHDLRQEPRRANLIWLYRQTPRKKPNPDAQRTVIDRYKLSFPTTFGEVHNLLAESGVDVFSLLVSGWLRCSLETAITQSTQLYLTGEKDNEWFFISQKHGF